MVGFEAMLEELATTRARFEDRYALSLPLSERAGLRSHLHELRAALAADPTNPKET